MSGQDIATIIGAIVAALLMFGGGIKWVLMHIDAKQLTASAAESKARDELSIRLHEEIRVLRLEIATMHTEKKLYLKRIFQLERFIHEQPGIAIPTLDGWPPD